MIQGEIIDSDEAEMHGISFALSWCIVNHDIADEFVIRSDCTHVTGRIANLLAGFPLRENDWALEQVVLSKILHLQRSKRVTFEYVPAHTSEDITSAEGNRVADTFAGRASFASMAYGWREAQEDFIVFAES